MAGHYAQLLAFGPISRTSRSLISSLIIGSLLISIHLHKLWAGVSAWLGRRRGSHVPAPGQTKNAGHTTRRFTHRCGLMCRNLRKSLRAVRSGRLLLTAILYHDPRAVSTFSFPSAKKENGSAIKPLTPAHSRMFFLAIERVVLYNNERLSVRSAWHAVAAPSKMPIREKQQIPAGNAWSDRHEVQKMACTHHNHDGRDPRRLAGGFLPFPGAPEQFEERPHALGCRMASAGQRRLCTGLFDALSTLAQRKCHFQHAAIGAARW